MLVINYARCIIINRMEHKNINQNAMPELRLFPRIDKVVGALKHLVFRYPDEPFATHGDNFVLEPKEL